VWVNSLKYTKSNVLLCEILYYCKNNFKKKNLITLDSLFFEKKVVKRVAILGYYKYVSILGYYK